MSVSNDGFHHGQAGRKLATGRTHMSASIVLVAAARLPRWLAYRAVRRHHFSVISPSLTNQKPGGRRLATQPGILDVTPRSGEATEVALRDDAMLD
jgi:hypothetical protein